MGRVVLTISLAAPPAEKLKPAKRELEPVTVRAPSLLIFLEQPTDLTKSVDSASLKAVTD
jgi:hypothetical protein